MPSIKSLLPLVLVVATTLAIPQGVNPAETAKNAVTKTLNGRGEAPRRELVQVYTRDTNEKGSGGIGGTGGRAGPGGDGTKYGKGGDGARGGSGGSGGSGEYFSGKLIEDDAERSGRQGGEKKVKNYSGDKFFFRRGNTDHNGVGGMGGVGGSGSDGGNGREFGRGGSGAQGGNGGNGGRGKYFNGIKDESGKDIKKGDRKEGEKEYY